VRKPTIMLYPQIDCKATPNPSRSLMLCSMRALHRIGASTGRYGYLAGKDGACRACRVFRGAMGRHMVFSCGSNAMTMVPVKWRDENGDSSIT